MVGRLAGVGVGVVNPRTEAARALRDTHGLFHGHRAAGAARDLMARLSTRAVSRWDWPAATMYAAAYELLTDIHDRALTAAVGRYPERVS